MSLATSESSEAGSDTQAKGSSKSSNSQRIVVNADINSAAALRAQYAIETPKLTRRRHKRLTRQEAEESIVDETSSLTLHSKKTERLQKRQQKRGQKAADRIAVTTTLLDLPSEILTDIICWLSVADVFRISRTSKAFHDLIATHEKSIAQDIIQRRYWVLYRCFPLPVSLDRVPVEYHEGMLSDRRQELLNIHRKSYHQHIEMINPRVICTCMTCVFAWNNLCLIIDLHHWQHSLANRDPLPMIPRGTNPEWNQQLLKSNADIVRLALQKPFFYAAILEKHLHSITGTISRFARWKKKGASAKPRLYHLTDWDIARNTDEFLDRSGPPSYDFPYIRDNYYSIEAYLPNRKWGNDGSWHYYGLPPMQHERDLEWIKSTTSTTSDKSAQEKRAQALANLKDHNIRWSQYLEKLDQT